MAGEGILTGKRTHEVARILNGSGQYVHDANVSMVAGTYVLQSFAQDTPKVLHELQMTCDASGYPATVYASAGMWVDGTYYPLIKMAGLINTGTSVRIQLKTPMIIPNFGVDNRFQYVCSSVSLATNIHLFALFTNHI